MLTLFWFRRDLRFEDNAGLYHALKNNPQVLPIFIFDENILNSLEDKTDARVNFIHQTLAELKKDLQKLKSDLIVCHGKPLEVFEELSKRFEFKAIYTNHDYEPAARKRDASVEAWAKKNGLKFETFKDQTLFEKSEILTDAGKPYTVFTPYKRKVLSQLSDFYLKSYPVEKYKKSFVQIKPEKMMTLQELGFEQSPIEFPTTDLSVKMLQHYDQNRNFPYLEGGTSHLGLHLRFGTVSIRKLAREAKKNSDTWLSELIWRDFFMQILWHYPDVVKRSFRPEYDQIAWRNSPSDFKRWKEGMTGYPIVDAGMRELNATGYMHNRVRMVVASFLCKHLLIHWSEGERYFAEKLLDFDLSANNGNWQWCAGSGCDAAPYFRIFNPTEQQKKFDPDRVYIKKWIPEIDTEKYPEPMIDHGEARERCLREFTKVLKRK